MQKTNLEIIETFFKLKKDEGFVSMLKFSKLITDEEALYMYRQRMPDVDALLYCIYKMQTQIDLKKKKEK